MSVLGGFILRKVGGFSPEAQAVINRMTGLTTDEENAIAAFVDAEVLNTNWALIDEFWCFGLVTEANALTGWLNKTATNNGATKVSTGFSLDGSTDWINTNFTPSIDGINYILNDALFGAYVKTDNNPGGSSRTLMGYAGDLSARSLMNRGAGANLSFEVNRNPAGGNTSIANYGNENLYLAVREASNSSKLYLNGSLDSSDSSSSINLTNGDFEIGSLIGGTFGNFQGIISSSLIGAGIGFDHSGHNTNLNTLLTSLGVI